VAKDDAALATLIETSLKKTPDSLIVLVAGYNYYFLIKPDLTKLTDIINHIKAISDKTSNNPALKAYSDRIQSKLPKMTQEGLKPVDDKKRESIHMVFPDAYPGITVGESLQIGMPK
jgi:hypothetical protein